ncbi:MAG: hypothetical protein ACRC5C_07280, partial [Bacilli bacterium]
EHILYDGISDHIEIAYDEIEKEKSSIAIKNESGEIIGEPYTQKGKRIYLSLSQFEKDLYRNSKFEVEYKVKNSYTIDYDIEAVDGYRIGFANHDGEEKVVFQEGNRFAENKKLLKQIDLNNIENHNTKGFLVVSDEVEDAARLECTLIDEQLRANGYESTKLIVEVYDKKGNRLSYPEITIQAEKGNVTRLINEDTFKLQKNSGQLTYMYEAPYLSRGNESRNYVEDFIWVKEVETGIGICKKMILKPTSSSDALPKRETTSNTKEFVYNYLLFYEGYTMKEHPALVSILDFNKDGLIDEMDQRLFLTGRYDNELNEIERKLKEAVHEAT